MAEVLNIYMKELSNERSTKEESLDLLRMARNGDRKSHDRLINNYLLLVVKIARKYMNKGVPMEDLIAEGNIGLMKAVEKYSFDKEAPFSTCAKHWIKQSIIRNCMHNNRLVRLPENVSEAMRTNRWNGSAYREISIDTPNDEGDTMADMIPDWTSHVPFQDEIAIINNQRLDNAFKALKPRDVEIVKACYGIGLEEPMEIAEAAKLFNLTTTRINQILRNSMKKMSSTTPKFDRLIIRENVSVEVEIISASYGTDDNRKDVTDKVVDLHLKKSPIKANNRLGGDPAPGSPKKLFISYIVGETIMEKEFAEGSIVKF
jgi:RNA polymerase sigma factor (sigma-70 family)